MNTLLTTGGDVNGDGFTDVIVTGRHGRMLWLENPGRDWGGARLGASTSSMKKLFCRNAAAARATCSDAAGPMSLTAPWRAVMRWPGGRIPASMEKSGSAGSSPGPVSSSFTTPP